MHPSTYEFLTPTADQKETMSVVRAAAKVYSDLLTELIPDGPDKTYLLRQLREVGMWANVAITRHADGSPRS